MEAERVKLIEGWMLEQVGFLADRGRLRGTVGRGPPIELVVEDGFDGAIGPGADLDGALGGRFDPHCAKGADQTDDAETGAITLLGMGPGLQDLLAQGRSRLGSRRCIRPRGSTG